VTGKEYLRRVEHRDSADDVGRTSRARDHLANERTYLAWLRTAVNVMVLGLAIAKFGGGNQAASFGAGGLLVVVGAAGVGQGTLRYRQVNTEIEAGLIVTPSNSSAAVVASTVLVLSIVIALVLLLATQD
jgi:putative membrane protein